MAAPKILLLTNRVPYPLTDGGNLAMDATLTAYLEAGFSVYLLSMNTSRHPVAREDWEPLYPSLSGKDWVEVDNRISLIPLLGNLVFSRRPYHVSRFRDSGFARKLEEVIRDFDPDYIQLESVYLSSYIPQIRALSSAKLLLRLHNLEYEIWERLAKGEKQPGRRFYLRSLAKRLRRYEESVWPQFDLLLPITPQDDQKVGEVVGDLPRVCWPFGWKGFSEHAVPPFRGIRRLYHLGAMDWLPNQEGIEWFLDQVWPRVRTLYPEAEFHFGGRNLPDRFREHQGKGVFVYGEVPSASAFMEDKDLLVVPLLSGGGIRVKVLEAMAAGKLVVSTRKGMEGIDARPGVHYLAADTPGEFLSALEWIGKEPERGAAMIQEAHSWVRKHYSNQELIKPVLEAMKRI